MKPSSSPLRLVSSGGTDEVSCTAAPNSNGGGAFIFFAQIQNLWMFYLAYILMAFGQGLGSWIPLMTMLNRWFNQGGGATNL